MKTITLITWLLVIGGLFGSGCSSTSTTPSDEAGSYYTQLGIGYLQKGRLDLATVNLEKALAQNPDTAEPHHYYALLQEKLGNDTKAAQHFRKALQYDSKNPDLLNNYGSFLCRSGSYTEAETAFLGAVRDPLYKTPEFAYTNAGICIRKQGDAERAESYFRQALQANPRFSEALYQMAKLNHEKGENAKAQAFLYRYNEAAPATADTLLLCYQVQQLMQEPAKAEACANALRAKFPDSLAASQVN